MTKSFLEKKLEEYNLNFTEKLKLIVKEGELDYWWRRKNPPNESVEVFKRVIELIKEVNPKWIERESNNGLHGMKGETKCFKFECDIKVLGIRKRYFIKGYFFDRDSLKGVTIQSFREVPLKFRIVGK